MFPTKLKIQVNNFIYSLSVKIKIITNSDWVNKEILPLARISN